MRRATLLFLFLVAPAGAGEGEERPFPTDRSTILREEGVVYVIEGKATIPRGVEISCQKEIRIRGRDGGAVLRVEGALKVHGVSSREVIFEAVTVELAPDFQDVQLDMAIFRGGGGVGTVRDAPARGKLFLENVRLDTGCALDVAMTAGSVDLSSVTSHTLTRIEAVDAEGRRNALDVNIRGSYLTALSVLRARDVQVRTTELLGGRASFESCGALDFDANKVTASELVVSHERAGGLARTKITKCDIYSGRLEVRAPTADGKSKDTVVVDRCWFEGETDEAALREKIVTDAFSDPRNGARLRFGKLMSRPNELAGSMNR